ncbi:hypothetical protein KNO81_39520 [Paraburkholderia sediminicola]|nr:hypothetical protein [Paraburkholderia sediminicola]
MTSISRFALEKTEGRSESWPKSAHLMVDGRRSGHAVPGHALLRQFETPSCYLELPDRAPIAYSQSCSFYDSFISPDPK